MLSAATDGTGSVKSILLPVVAAVVLLATITTGVHRRTQEKILVYEAENAIHVEPVFEIISQPETSSGKVLSIAPHKGRGWNNEAKGNAEYNIRTDQTGEYWLWLRAYWRSSCENAVYVSVNGGRPIIGGNDAIFNQWHWVKCGPLNFSAINSKLHFLNHSDGIMLDKFELVRGAYYQPAGYGSEVKHFFDGFGGCDGNNSGSWTIRSGNWQVTGDAAGNQNGRGAVMLQLSSGEALAVAEQLKLRNFRVQFMLQPGAGGAAGIALGWSKDSSFDKILWKENGDICFCPAAKTPEILLDNRVRSNMWSYWEAEYAHGILKVKVDNEPTGKPLKVSIGQGNCGLYTADCPYTAFDNIRIDCINE